MNPNIINYEFNVPSGVIKTSKSRWKFVSSLEDVKKIYVSMNEYLDKMHELTDTDILKLFYVSVKSNTRKYGTSDYKVEVLTDFWSEERTTIARDFSRTSSKQEKVYSDVFAPLEDTLEILRQSFSFFVKNGKFSKELEKKNEEVSKTIEYEITELRKEIESRFQKIFNKEEYISKRKTVDKEWFTNYQKEKEYERQVKEGILTWYAASFKGERERDPRIPYIRRENPDFYKMIIDESTGEGTLYKLKDKSLEYDDKRGYIRFFTVCSDKIEREVGRIPNATREKAKKFIMGLNSDYEVISETSPGKKIDVGFEDSGD